MWNYQSPIGTREAVLAHVNENLKVDEKRFPGEVAQVEAVKSFITSRLSTLELNGVRVVAQGRIDPNSQTVTITLQPQKVLV